MCRIRMYTRPAACALFVEHSMFRVADMRKRTAIAPKIIAHLYTWGPGHTTAEGEHVPVQVSRSFQKGSRRQPRLEPNRVGKPCTAQPHSSAAFAQRTTQCKSQPVCLQPASLNSETALASANMEVVRFKWILSPLGGTRSIWRWCAAQCGQQPHCAP